MKKTMPTQRNCLIFDLFKEGSITNVFLGFTTNLTGVQILMESSTRFADRDLSAQSRYRTGHDIVMLLNTIVHKTYDVMLSKNTFMRAIQPKVVETI